MQLLSICSRGGCFYRRDLDKLMTVLDAGSRVQKEVRLSSGDHGGDGVMASTLNRLHDLSKQENITPQLFVRHLMLYDPKTRAGSSGT